MKLSDLSKQHATVKVEIEGLEPFGVTYNRAAHTPEFQSELDAANASESYPVIVARLVARLVSSWEVYDDDGKEVPLDESILLRTPTIVLTKIMDAINEDMSGTPTEETRKGGSFDAT